MQTHGQMDCFGAGIKIAQKGLTLVELIVTAALVALALSSVIFLFRSGSGSSEALARTSALELGWQRLITAVRDDMRSATEAKSDETMLKISISKVDADSSALTSSEVAYFLASDGYFWRQDSSNTRKFAFTSQQSNLAASLTFALIASNSISIDLSVVDTRTSNRILERNEVLAIAGQ